MTLLRHLLTLALALLIALPAVTLVGCSGAQTDAAEASTTDSDEDGETDRRRGDDEDEDEEDEPDPVPVQVTTLDIGSIEEVLRYSTNLEAEDDVAVFAEASRKVVRLLAEEGDWVRKGQTLLRLQDDEQRTRLAKAQVQYDKAAREYERQTRLHAQELIAEQVFNDATYEVERLELELEEARRELSYTEVKAPISGTVTERLVNLGDYVTNNQKLFHIVDFNSLVARVFVPEKELRRLAVRQQARIHAPALGEDLFAGSIDRLAPVVDPQSGTVKVTVDVPTDGGLRPGMYVDVELVTAVRDDALLVPKRALVYDEDQVFVYRIGENMTAERVFIQTLLEDKDNVQPSGSVEIGDRLVIAGQAGLKEGALVRLVAVGESA